MSLCTSTSQARASIAVELGIENGTEVIIKAVIPHPTDDVGLANSHERIVKLSRPPICVFVHVDSRKWTKEYVQGKPTWFPIMPIAERMAAPKEFETKATFERTQIPLTLAYYV